MDYAQIGKIRKSFAAVSAAVIVLSPLIAGTLSPLIELLPIIVLIFCGISVWELYDLKKKYEEIRRHGVEYIAVLQTNRVPLFAFGGINILLKYIITVSVFIRGDRRRINLLGLFNPLPGGTGDEIIVKYFDQYPDILIPAETPHLRSFTGYLTMWLLIYSLIAFLMLILIFI